MSRKRRRARVILSVAAGFVAVIYLMNTSRLADPIGDRTVLLAHRGLGQGFAKEGLTGKTCTAARMHPPEHDYLENTIRSMYAAFDLGADVVELDVHRTSDGRLAVFHDWTLDCRTEGTGVTHEHSLEELKALDVGYGYTADGGQTWPFRGKGVGLMPSLDEVLAEFPDRDFLIDVKSNDEEDGALLAERLAEAVGSHRGELMVYGGARPVNMIRERVPDIRSITRPRLKRCLTRYIALGWTGYVPSDCERSVVTVPANIAPWLWGWPNRFLQRMDGEGSRVFVIGDYGGEGSSTGFDDPGRVKKLSRGYSGGIWTDRIDVIGPAVRRNVEDDRAERE